MGEKIFLSQLFSTPFYHIIMRKSISGIAIFGLASLGFWKYYGNQTLAILSLIVVGLLLIDLLRGDNND